MSFLTIPSQKGLFTTIESGKCNKEAQSMSSTYDEENNEFDEDDDEDEPRFIPRSSPVPRKRGSSIHDETAEYMRIHLALSAGKRVSFADTTGGDLVDVKEFVAFDSDEEEERARCEEESPMSRRPEREPIYQVHPEFTAPGRGDLLQAVRNNKVEVEQVCQVHDEPLAFTGLIRVLNISFQKAVYIRSTMDSWLTYYDHPAEYVQGSHDGDTDQFSFKLSFAPPYVTHGSRIEFVVRYETADGDFWANNSSLNYVVTLLLAYDEDDAVQVDADVQQIRSILKPPKPYSMNDDLDSEDEQEKEEAEGAGTSRTGLIRPKAVCPVIVQPEIDIEIADNPSGVSVKPNHEPPSEDGTLFAQTGSPGERFPSLSSETTLQTSSSLVQCASEILQPNELPTLHCELGNQASAQHVNSSSFAPPSSPQQESRQGSDGSQAEGEESSPSEAPLTHPSTTETNQMQPTGEDESTERPASSPPLELAAVCVCAPSAAEGFVQEVDMGLSELVAGSSEGFSRSAAHGDDSTPSLPSLVASPQASVGAEGAAPSSPELAEHNSMSAGVNEASADAAPQSASASEEKEDAPRISPDTLLENLSSTVSEASERKSEPDVSRNLMPSIVFLCGVVSLSIVMQEPNTLFFIGLLLLLHHL